MSLRTVESLGLTMETKAAFAAYYEHGLEITQQVLHFPGGLPSMEFCCYLLVAPERVFKQISLESLPCCFQQFFFLIKHYIKKGSLTKR